MFIWSICFGCIEVVWVMVSVDDDVGPPDGPEFSVVIPAYNYGLYLSEAIDSVLSQGGVSFEVMVVDDGSTDETEAIVAGYGDRVGYYRQVNRGPYVANIRIDFR